MVVLVPARVAASPALLAVVVAQKRSLVTGAVRVLVQGA